ncbi:adenosylcobinamide-phosphate synthase CbiB [[Mycobacterium] crassicus]|uniref:Cobalamin biosynthesis protein CobD n=1 Tax=[Mycobacterium] crassicus TaxID=2872309 RepID=A0ABU5XDI2_9MYCO|nr:adenosylcobinamide-phosphate synthase CbiB [Mycolicibacter sp. MYC098]MEB3019848.1 adenosylcobinamide-phosphate synthase CbiB [Mycolicibacter sp. MYC098]
MPARALGLMLGYGADQLWGDPRRLHPVAGLGTCAQCLERRTYRDSRVRGVAHVLVLAGGATGLAYLAERSARYPLARTALTAAVTWAVLGGRSLEREAMAVHEFLDAGDIERARVRVRNLVGRDTAALSPDEIARAVVESVAENTSDAVVGSLLWGAAAGVPGLVAHRVANTLDAMIGHRNARYERFGWAAARLDDVLGLPASRMSGTLTVATGPDPVGALRAWRRDARHHPSPNAGVAEASFAGALGLKLGGVNIYYGNRREDRALMGDGRVPTPPDIPRAVRLARRVGVGAMLSAVALCLAGRRR